MHAHSFSFSPIKVLAHSFVQYGTLWRVDLEVEKSGRHCSINWRMCIFLRCMWEFFAIYFLNKLGTRATDLLKELNASLVRKLSEWVRLSTLLKLFIWEQQLGRWVWMDHQDDMEAKKYSLCVSQYFFLKKSFQILPFIWVALLFRFCSMISFSLGT